MQLKQSTPSFYRPIAAAFCLGFLTLSAPAQSQQSDAGTTLDNVQAEFSEAFATIGAYTAQERDEALTELDATLQRLDEQIEETEVAVRDEWSEMSQATREQTAAAMRTLHERRNQLSEATGALSQGMGTAWDDLMAGVRNGWNDLELAWDDAAAAVGPDSEKEGN